MEKRESTTSRVDQLDACEGDGDWRPRLRYAPLQSPHYRSVSEEGVQGKEVLASGYDSRTFDMLFYLDVYISPALDIFFSGN